MQHKLLIQNSGMQSHYNYNTLNIKHLRLNAGIFEAWVKYWTFDKPVGFALLIKNRNSARLNRGNII